MYSGPFQLICIYSSQNLVHESNLLVTEKHYSTHFYMPLYKFYTIRRSMIQFPVTGNVVPSSLIILILMKEAIRSSETSLQEPHDVTSQKTKFSELAPRKSQNLTEY
jgi:hypothetical protein